MSGGEFGVTAVSSVRAVAFEVALPVDVAVAGCAARPVSVGASVGGAPVCGAPVWVLVRAVAGSVQAGRAAVCGAPICGASVGGVSVRAVAGGV